MPELQLRMDTGVTPLRLFDRFYFCGSAAVVDTAAFLSLCQIELCARFRGCSVVMDSLLWVKTDDAPWWPAKRVQTTPAEGYAATVVYFGGDEVGYIARLDDESCVRYFQDKPDMMDGVADADLQLAIKEAKKQLRAERKAARIRPYRGLPGRDKLSDHDLLQIKAKLDHLQRDAPEALAELRALVNVDVDVDQLYRTKIGIAVSRFSHSTESPFVSTLASGILQYWFCCLDDDTLQRLQYA